MTFRTNMIFVYPKQRLSNPAAPFLRHISLSVPELQDTTSKVTSF